MKAILKEGRDQGVANMEPEFFRKTNYYIAHGLGNLTKVSLKKNKRDHFFATLTEEQTVTLKAYIKKNKIKLKKEEDFVQLFQQGLTRK